MKSEKLNFYDLRVWQQAHQISIEIYALTKKFPIDERFGMISQLRRAATSVTANIAEGYERYYFKDKIRFYYQARGSAAEIQSFILLARDLQLVTVDESLIIMDKVAMVKALLNGLIRSNSVAANP